MKKSILLGVLLVGVLVGAHMSDAATSTNGSCSANQFQCTDGRCIRLGYRCDGITDCYDRSDEDVDICYPAKEMNLEVKKGETLEINHPEHNGNYGKRERITWRVTNEDPQAVGFEVFIERYSMEFYFDRLKIEGDKCSYGYGYFPIVKTLTLEGDNLTISWTTDSRLVSTGFTLRISSIYEVNNTECSEYVCSQEGRCFKVEVENRISWSDSRAVCEDQGGRLAVITDQSTNDFIQRMLNGSTFDVWIGLSGTVGDIEHMTWVDGNSTESYGYHWWSDDELAYYKEVVESSGMPLDTEICAMFTNRKLSWRATHCFLSRGFICEKVGDK